MSHSVFPFQTVGINFLVEHQRALLGDEMGLGKTVQALRAFDSGPALVVCPKALILEWYLAIKQWQPDWKVYSVKKTDDRGWWQLGGKVGLHSVGLINYASLHKYIERISKVPFKTLVIDEAHFVKNRKTRRSKGVAQLARKIKRVFLLTGTPPLARPHEMWHLLHLLSPNSFKSYWRFFDRHVAYWVLPSTGGKVPIGIRDAEDFAAELSPWMLRRLRAEVLDLPQLFKNAIPGLLCEKERGVYDLVLRGHVRDTEGELIDFPNILAKLTVLRKLATSSYLVTDTRPIRVAKVDMLLEKVKNLSTPFIVFTHFVATKQIVGDALSNAGIGYVNYDGLSRWREGLCQAFVETYYKGGLGLNLQRASDLFLLEPPRGRTDLEQAIGRIRRPGGYEGTQFVWRIYAHETVDEHFWRHLDKLGENAREVELALAVWRDVVRERRE